MQYGISALSLIPVRKEPSEKSEMVTQILFGEYFLILEEMVGWCRVKLAWDGYMGWIDSKMITEIDEKTYRKIEKKPIAVSGDIISLVKTGDNQNLILAAGSTLPLWRPYLKEFTVGDKTYHSPGRVLYGKFKNPRNMVINQALKYYNTPYLWGGRSPFGIDCSGFSQIVYKMIGISIPRDASMQINEGRSFGYPGESEPGDLAFFDDDEGNIVHVGIIWEQNKIIHASGKVRVDNLDQFGIFNENLKRYTHKLHVMKKIINTYKTGLL